MADNRSVSRLSEDRHSLLNREKFPVRREFQRVRWVFAAIGCILRTELRDINGLILIFARLARTRMRARRGGNGRWRHAMRVPARAVCSRCRPPEQRRDRRRWIGKSADPIGGPVSEARLVAAIQPKREIHLNPA